MTIEKQYIKQLNESIESDFSIEVAKRKFNELCKRIGSVLASDVDWFKADPRNFDAFIEALTYLRTAMSAKDNQLADLVSDAENALDKDRV